MNKKIKILIIDESKNTTITDMDIWLFKSLGIKTENVKKHKSFSALNKTVAEFIKNFGSN